MSTGAAESMAGAKSGTWDKTVRVLPGRAAKAEASRGAPQREARPSTSPPSEPSSVFTIVFPRRKAGQSCRSGNQGPVLITLDVLSEYSHLPLSSVAKSLGISLTAMKKACRNVGVSRWPFKKSSEDGEGMEGEDMGDSPSPQPQQQGPKVASQPAARSAAAAQQAEAAAAATPEIKPQSQRPRPPRAAAHTKAPSPPPQAPHNFSVGAAYSLHHPLAHAHLAMPVGGGGSSPMGGGGQPHVTFRHRHAASPMDFRRRYNFDEGACDRVIKTSPSGTTTDDDDIDEDELAQCVIQSMEERTQNIAQKDDKGKTLSDGSF